MRIAGIMQHAIRKEGVPPLCSTCIDVVHTDDKKVPSMSERIRNWLSRDVCKAITRNVPSRDEDYGVRLERQPYKQRKEEKDLTATFAVVALTLFTLMTKKAPSMSECAQNWLSWGML